MKNRKSEYHLLKRKLSLQLLLLLSIAGALVIVLRFSVSGRFGNGVVNFMQRYFFMDYENAMIFYRHIFRDNINVLMGICFLVLLIVLYQFAVTWFTSFFDEIQDGLDQLITESDKTITLSPELEFMENKLNRAKEALEKREKDAKNAEQRKNDLVVYLAHDIKTPLTSVIGYLSLLDEAQDMPLAQKAKYVGITLEKAYRLEQLINEFFEITRFNLQTIVLNKERIKLPFMLSQIADEFYPMLSPQGKKTEVKAEEDLWVYGDADKLARVFNNILKNAVAYSYDNSKIEIHAYLDEGNAVITFSNQGDTIPAQKLEMIFEKFYRLDNARGSSTGGSGLGLAIAKEIAEAHGGEIFAVSSEEKTAFTVRLPFAAKE